MSEFKDEEISLYKKLKEITENYSLYSDQIAVIVRYVIENYTLKQKKKPVESMTQEELKIELLSSIIEYQNDNQRILLKMAESLDRIETILCKINNK